MKYTGVRQEQYESLKASRRSITKETYEQAIKDLNRKEKAAQKVAAKREAEREKREIARILAEIAAEEAKAAARKEKQKAAAKARREKKKQAKEDARVFGRFKIDVGTTVDSPEVVEISKAANGSFEAVVKVNGVVRRISNFEFGTESASIRHTVMRQKFYFWEGSAGESIFESTEENKDLKPSDTIEILLRRRTEKLSGKRIKTQAFAEGERNCVAEPLAKIWDKAAEVAITKGSANKETIRKCQQRARACRAYGLQYPDGIPEGEAMEEMARIARRRVIVHDVMSGEYSTYNEKCPKIARFTNTREGHLDVGHISFDEKPEIVTAERLQEIIEEHGTTHYMFEGRNGKETAIRSARGCWAVSNPLFEMYKRQNELNNIQLFGLDAVRHPKPNKWLQASNIIQSTCVLIGEDVPVYGHIDLKHAYTQHPLVPERYRRGFPGMVQQWRKLDKELVPAVANPKKFVEDHFGIYRFRVLENTDPLMVRLGLLSNHILPGPELLYYLDHGLKVELLSGVFASSFDVTYIPELMDAKEYALWAGCLSHDKPTKQYHFKGTRQWAEHLAGLFGESNVWYADGRITLLRPKAMNHTKHHILSFITGYLRINTLEAMRKIGIENVIGVQMDGIFHKDCSFEMPAGFRVKEYKEPTFNEASKWFSDRSDVDDSTWSLLRDERLLSHCVLAGQGGAGKTYSLLKPDEGMDSPWNDILYVVPQHDLGQDKRTEFGVNYATYCSTAGLEVKGKKTQSLAEKGRQPAVMPMDEGTMISANAIEKIRKLYPHTLLFFIADIEVLPDGRFMWFQCRNGRPGVFSEIWQPPADWGWITYTTDYRSKDEQLKALKLWLRDRMRANFTDGGPKDSRAIMMDILLNNDLKVLPRKQAVPLFVPGDTWIAGTNEKSSLLLREGIVSGWVSRNGFDRGSKSFVEVEGWEKRGSFTTHSFQGQTVKKGKLFVSINDAFEHAMIYTAISRATSYDQIVLVS
jgi:hypothetical protein